MVSNMKANVKNAKVFNVEVDKEYPVKQFVCEVDTYCELSLPNGIYGTNETRIDNKSISLNGIVIRNVEHIIIECTDEMLWFVCLDKDCNIVASRQIKRNEMLVVNETAVDTYEYNFIKAVK